MLIPKLRLISIEIRDYNNVSVYNLKMVTFSIICIDFERFQSFLDALRICLSIICKSEPKYSVRECMSRIIYCFIFESHIYLEQFNISINLGALLRFNSG